MTTLIIVILSVLLNIFLINKSIKYITEIEEIQYRFETEKDIIYSSLQTMLERMQEIDIRGSFESDDEVGSVFTELKNLIKHYNETINQ